MRMDPLDVPDDERFESRFQHRFRWMAILGMVVLAIVTTELGPERTRYFALFMGGYMFHGFVHSFDMTLEHRRLEKLWQKLNAYRDKLQIAEQQIMRNSLDIQP